VAPLLALAAASCVGAPQTRFGQNQVQYDRFDFKILATEHFDIYYYDEEKDAVREAGRMAERWYTRLSRLLNHELSTRQPLMLYASHPHFRQTLAVGGSPGEGTGGVTELFKRRIVLPLAGPLKETDHVLGHEIVHAFQFDMTGSGGVVTNRNFARAVLLPLWFIEGMAEYLSVGPVDPHTAMWLRDAAAHDRLPNMRQLNDPRFFPYRFGQAFWAYVAGRWGDPIVGRILNAAARGAGADAAMARVLSIPVDSVNAEWHEAIEQSLGTVKAVTSVPSDFGEVLLSREEGSVLNTAPALSPDGTDIAFISFRGFNSLGIYHASVATGEVEGKLVETETDSHLESFEFIQSAGTWSPDGTRFVFSGVHDSDPALYFVTAADNMIAKQRIFPELGEIFNPAWSPDGESVAFSALVGGFSDLFIYHIATDQLERITSDGYADLQPAWSPDNRSVAFVTDRFTTELPRLRYGAYQLALYDVSAGTIDSLPTFDRGKQINPQWSADGGSVYFLSDRNGITDVYRVELETGDLYQITDIYTGVTGITALSPALSSALKTDKLAFSVYERGGYSIYTVSSPTRLRGRRLTS